MMNDNKSINNDNPTIMLVDDDVSMRLVGREILQKNHFNIIEAEDGLQAVELYKKIFPDIILMDVKMPGLNGYDACTQIRQCLHGEHVPIVMMTGLDDQESIDCSYQVGATDFIPKPVNWTILVNRLRYILRTCKMTQNLDIARSDLELAISSLDRNQKLLTKAQELAKIGSWEFDFKKNEFRFSESLYDILGINKKEINVNLNLKLKNVDEDSKPLALEAVNFVKERKHKKEIEYWVNYIQKNETVSRYVKEIIEFNPNPEPHLLGTIQDISKIKKNEIELFKLNENLEKRVRERTEEINKKNNELTKAMTRLKSTQEKLFSYKKMAAFSEMLVGISHEIRNPLNFVINFSDMSKSIISDLKENFKDDLMKIISEKSENKKNAENILTELENNMELIFVHARQIESIVNMMLKHTARAPMTLTKGNIIKIIEQSIDDAIRMDAFFNKIRIIRNYPENIKDINLMPTEISRVIVDFLKDASYFTQLKKSVSDSSYQPQLEIIVENSKKHIIVSIKDNGVGISEKYLDKIFNPFFTTKATGQGAGLGLSLAWDIITIHHGGKLTVESVEGEFCKFTFIIPKKLKESRTHGKSEN